MMALARSGDEGVVEYWDGLLRVLLEGDECRLDAWYGCQSDSPFERCVVG